jgi:myosin heavy subunit
VNKILQKVAQARRRLVIGYFFNVLSWSVFSCLLLAAIGLAIPKIWHLSFLQSEAEYQNWVYSWIAGGALLGVLIPLIVTWQKTASQLSAAIEVDRRFGLKERLSSALTLDSEIAETSVGQALLNDAADQAEIIDVRDEFRYQPTARAFLPLIPVLLLFGIMMIPNAEKKAGASEPERVDAKQVELAIKELKKQIEEKRKERITKGLKDADGNVKALEKKFDKLINEKTSDKKDVLIKLNDIKKQIAERQKELGSSKELKESLNKLKDAGEGPAKELADAMSKGDMADAKKAIKELLNKLKAGELSEVEKKKLVKDLKKMADEIKKAAQQNEAEKQKLEEQIKKALKEGDVDKAAQLQQKLEEKKAMDQQQEKLKKMGEKLAECADCMKPGDKAGGQKPGQQGEQGNPQEQDAAMKQAGEALEDLAKQMEQMEKEMGEMEALEDLEQMADDCKAGISEGKGQGKNDGPPKWQDWAQGSGKGAGKRSLEEEDTGTFKSKVKGKLQQGQTVVTGTADGKNLVGRSVSETRDLIQASLSKESDPLENQKMSRIQREHAQQYFKSLREK